MLSHIIYNNGIKGDDKKPPRLISVVPESLRGSGTARVELKSSHGYGLFPRALIRAREQSVRAEIRPGPQPGDSAQLGPFGTPLKEIDHMKVKIFSVRADEGFRATRIGEETRKLSANEYLEREIQKFLDEHPNSQICPIQYRRHCPKDSRLEYGQRRHRLGNGEVRVNIV